MAEEALKPQAQLHSEFEADLNMRRARRGSLDMAAREQAATDMAKAIANLVATSSENQDEGEQRRPRRASYLLKELDTMESELRPIDHLEKNPQPRYASKTARTERHKPAGDTPDGAPPASSLSVPPISGRRPLLTGAGDGERSGVTPRVDAPARSEAGAPSEENASKGAFSRALGKAGGRFGIGSSRTPRASREEQLPRKERPGRRSKDSVMAADIGQTMPFR